VTLGRTAALTDRGRKRRRNEDAFVCEPPLFAVADGMGGAQAGEIASRLAAAAIREDPAAGAAAEEHVTVLIQEANRRVYERSSADEAASGMGTTMTVALVQDGQVTIGHVGDSRAYLFRGGRLEQVTEDHSLVAELVRSGRLSPEEAESHPQRSVITRVLGTEPDVDVDTFTVAVEPGDLFLLCSDGLTAMVDDGTILGIVEQKRSDLDAAAKALVQAANRGGGEDNITIVFFEIAGAGEDAAEVGAADGRPAQEEDEDTLSGLVPLPAVEEPEWDEELEYAPAPPRRRLSRRAWIALASSAVLLAIAAAVGLFALSRAHFVGAEKDGHVAVYQGVPWDVIGGLRLYRTVYVSPVVAAQLSQAERRRLFDHDLTSEETALRKVRRYELEITP
jgi:serine/threonine protein phosphatase PrpC